MTKDLGRCAKSLNLTAPLGVMTELPSQLSLEEGQVLKTYPGLNSLMAARKPFQLLRDIRTAVGYLSNISRVAGRVPILVKAQTPAQRSFKGIKQMGGEVWAAAILIQSGWTFIIWSLWAEKESAFRTRCFIKSLPSWKRFYSQPSEKNQKRMKYFLDWRMWKEIGNKRGRRR